LQANAVTHTTALDNATAAADKLREHLTAKEEEVARMGADMAGVGEELQVCKCVTCKLHVKELRVCVLDLADVGEKMQIRQFWIPNDSIQNISSRLNVIDRTETV